MEEQKYSAGDFVILKGLKNKAYFILKTKDEGQDSKYICELSAGKISIESQDEIVAKADDAQKREWIMGRTELLGTPELVARFVQKIMKRLPRRAEVDLKEVLADLIGGVEFSSEGDALRARVHEILTNSPDNGTDNIICRQDGENYFIGLKSTAAEPPQNEPDTKPLKQAEEEPFVATQQNNALRVQGRASRKRGGKQETEASLAANAGAQEMETATESTISELTAVNAGEKPTTHPAVEEEVLINALLTEQILTDEQQAGKLVDLWENALPKTEAGQRELAEEMRQFLKPQEIPEAVKMIDRLLEGCDIEPATPHPLFLMLSGSATPSERRDLIARLNLIQLEHYIGWLVEQNPVPSAQMENLMDTLSDELSQKFQAANREGGVNHYRRIAVAMNKLLRKLDLEARQPYEWRLFSFLREGWARIVPHAQAGSNDLSGARDYLLWILASKDQWPEIIWKELLTSILQDAALDKLAAEVRQSLFEAAAEYALAAEPGKRSMQLLVMQQALSEEMLLEFIIVTGRKADQAR